MYFIIDPHLLCKAAFYQSSDGKHSSESWQVCCDYHFHISRILNVSMPNSLSHFIESCSVCRLLCQAVQSTDVSCLYFDGAAAGGFALVTVKKCGSNNQHCP